MLILYHVNFKKAYGKLLILNCQAPGPGLDKPGPQPGQPGHQLGQT